MAESLTDLKIGKIVKVGSDPFVILKADFLRKQQRKPVMKTKLRNLVNGSVLEKTFLAGEAFEFAEVANRKCQFLYKDNDFAYFMDQETYDQFQIALEAVEEQMKFLLDGNDVYVSFYEEKPISVQLPPKVELKVVETPPGVKGDTASGGGKPAKLETGITVTVPFFINEGDIIRVNTETYEYVERVS